MSSLILISITMDILTSSLNPLTPITMCITMCITVYIIMHIMIIIMYIMYITMYIIMYIMYITMYIMYITMYIIMYIMYIIMYITMHIMYIIMYIIISIITHTLTPTTIHITMPIPLTHHQLPSRHQLHHTPPHPPLSRQPTRRTHPRVVDTHPRGYARFR